ncbi:MAG: photosystem I assembly protein Ycf3 [Firmicutes bacterium ADurb.Bin419]|nr:MAG: photosystem I assembly protein Ycf3 [Firmicutes bacterium ADurb.Bin419]
MKNVLKASIGICFVIVSIFVLSSVSFAQTANEYYNEGISLMESGNYSEAIQKFNKAIEINPNYSKYYYSKAVCFSNLGKYNDAIMLYDNALELNPGLDNALINKAACLLEANRFEEALETVDYFINENSEVTDAYLLKSNILLNMKRYTDVIDVSDKLIVTTRGQKKSLSLAYSNKGKAFSFLGRITEAIRASNKALELDSTNMEAYVAMSFAFNYEKNMTMRLKCVTK